MSPAELLAWVDALRDSERNNEEEELLWELYGGIEEGEVIL